MLAEAADALADKLEAAGLKEEARKFHGFLAVLKNSESTSKELRFKAISTHELAQKLREDDHLERADEMEKLALQLDGAAMTNEFDTLCNHPEQSTTFTKPKPPPVSLQCMQVSD